MSFLPVGKLKTGIYTSTSRAVLPMCRGAARADHCYEAIDTKGIEMNELWAAMGEIARVIRVASKDRQRTLRVVFMTIVFGATIISVSLALALTIGQL
jgi:hypothetical protein